eukprot:5572932-Alexandrium_andersonii.AAC.1
MGWGWGGVGAAGDVSTNPTPTLKLDMAPLPHLGLADLYLDATPLQNTPRNGVQAQPQPRFARFHCASVRTRQDGTR